MRTRKNNTADMWRSRTNVRTLGRFARWCIRHGAKDSAALIKEETYRLGGVDRMQKAGFWPGAKLPRKEVVS
jgi:hypothetical protein